MENTITITLPLPPLGVNHAYATNNGRWYKSQKLKDWEIDCLWEFKRMKKNLFVPGDRSVSLSFYDKDKRRRDIDGRIKPILDLLTRAGVYYDDVMVNELHAYKYIDSINPRLEVTVSSRGIVGFNE